jgi:hypothetical protein
MRFNPSSKTQKPEQRRISSGPRRPGKRRAAIVELLIGRTRLLVRVDKGDERHRRTLLEDNPTSG